MEDSTRFKVQRGQQDRPKEASGEVPPRERRDSSVRDADGDGGSGVQAPRASTPGKPFVGNAMLALLESGDVRVARGDETRVISKDHGDVLEQFAGEAIGGTQLPPVGGAQPGTQPASTPAPPMTHTSAPPGPRVDVTLWAVLAVGLFAIAAWMMFYAL